MAADPSEVEDPEAVTGSWSAADAVPVEVEAPEAVRGSRSGQSDAG